MCNRLEENGQARRRERGGERCLRSCPGLSVLGWSSGCTSASPSVDHMGDNQLQARERERERDFWKGQSDNGRLFLSVICCLWWILVYSCCFLHRTRQCPESFRFGHCLYHVWMRRVQVLTNIVFCIFLDSPGLVPLLLFSVPLRL